MEFDSLFDEYQMKKMKKMKKTKGGVLGFRNLGIIDRLRGNVYNPDRPDNYNPQPGTREAEINLERDRRRINQRRRPNEDFEMIGQNEIDEARAALQPNTNTGIEMTSANGGSIMTALQAIANNPVVKREALNAMNRFNQTNFGQDLAEARRIRMARGGFIDPMNLMNAYLGSRNSSNPAASMAARAVLGNFLPSSLTNMGLGAIGLGKNKKAKGGFILPLMAAQAMGLNPISAIRGIIGMGKNRKDILFYPKDEVSGGFLNPITLATLHTLAPLILKNKHLGAIMGSGKKFKFQHNEELLNQLNSVRGGASAQYYRNLASGVANNLGLASGLSGALSFTPLAPIAAPMAATLGAISGILKAASTIGTGDPREYRRPSHTARKEQLALANIRGVETSNAKGGYVHRPTKSNKYENMQGGAMCGNMHAVGGSRSARAAIVKDVMNERGVSMIEASKIVKNEGLY